MKPEEVARELRKLNCPYEALDPRSTAWLQGYHAGYNEAFEAAKDTVRTHFARKSA